MSRAEFLRASPVIALANAGHTHLITALSEQAVIPEAVAADGRAGPADGPAHQWIEAGFAVVIGTPPPPRELLAWDLGAGEDVIKALRAAGLRVDDRLGQAVLRDAVDEDWPAAGSRA